MGQCRLMNEPAGLNLPCFEKEAMFCYDRARAKSTFLIKVLGRYDLQNFAYKPQHAKKAI